ncbi:MAG: tyrosine-type recombinase/integrase [Hyphomonadaceae bacterium]|nr:tyrosine-type recombinase/integrase [Hyphomonadaceae bacterium]
MKFDLPYIFEDRDRHGNVRLFVRLPGKTRRKIRLREKPRSEAFFAEYWEARRAPPPEAAPRIQPARHGSLRWLIESYYRSPEFADLDKTHTQRERRRQLDPLIEAHGARPARMDTKTIRDGIVDRQPARARKFLSALRHMYRWAVDAGHVTSDPTAGLRARKQKTSGFHSWTAEDRAIFEAHWPLGTKQRTAYAIARYSMARRSDICRIGRPMERAGGARIAYQQYKNRNRAPVWVEHPVVSKLREALTAWQGKGLTWLETEYGRPYSIAGLGNAFGDWAREAGLPKGRSLHGLRKSSAAQMAEAGASTKQLQAALGDTTLQQAEVYTRAADNARLADDAFGGVFGEQMDPPVRGRGSKSRKKS